LQNTTIATEGGKGSSIGINEDSQGGKQNRKERILESQSHTNFHIFNSPVFQGGQADSKNQSLLLQLLWLCVDLCPLK
jgi:hypothetical protein